MSSKWCCRLGSSKEEEWEVILSKGKADKSYGDKH